MKRLLAIASAVVLLGVAPIASSAHLFSLAATIDGAQAGTGSPGTGFASMGYDSNTGVFDWNIQWSGLIGTETIMHFHGPAAPGNNAGVQVNFGAISGTSSPSIGNAVITSAQADDLLAGLWYINIHTDLNPGGEIRGQVQVVPLPAAAWMLLSGLASLGFLKRRT